MKEGQKETRNCKGCGEEYEYVEGAVLGSAVLGSAVLGSDPKYCNECAAENKKH